MPGDEERAHVMPAQVFRERHHLQVHVAHEHGIEVGARDLGAHERRPMLGAMHDALREDRPRPVGGGIAIAHDLQGRASADQTGRERDRHDHRGPLDPPSHARPGEHTQGDAHERSEVTGGGRNPPPPEQEAVVGVIEEIRHAALARELAEEPHALALRAIGAARHLGIARGPREDRRVRRRVAALARAVATRELFEDRGQLAARGRLLQRVGEELRLLLPLPQERLEQRRPVLEVPVEAALRDAEKGGERLDAHPFGTPMEKRQPRGAQPILASA